MNWNKGGVGLSKPIKIWCNQWVTDVKLICIVENHALVKLKHPIGEYGYKVLDLKWYEDISNPDRPQSTRSVQLRNVKGEYQKGYLFRVKVTSWFANKVIGGRFGD